MKSCRRLKRGNLLTLLTCVQCTDVCPFKGWRCHIQRIWHKISTLRLRKQMKDWQHLSSANATQIQGSLGRFRHPLDRCLNYLWWVLPTTTCKEEFLRSWASCKSGLVVQKQRQQLCLGQFIVECHMHLSLSRSVFMHNVFASILELIHCFAANSKFRGANCSHKQQDVGVEEEKSVLALVCPGYSQSVSLSDCWFQFNSNPTWLLFFGDAAAKQELHNTRDIGIPWHQYWYRHRIWSPCIINSWEIDALT